MIGSKSQSVFIATYNNGHGDIVLPMRAFLFHSARAHAEHVTALRPSWKLVAFRQFRNVRATP